jgi:hypothetical protein
MDETILNHVKTWTEIFDASHNWEHALAVALYATSVINNKCVLWLSLLHDVADHKYPNALPFSDLCAWIRQHLPLQEAELIVKFIPQISFCKLWFCSRDFVMTVFFFLAKESKETNSEVHSFLRVVRDADRLEAIGYVHCCVFLQL